MKVLSHIVTFTALITLVGGSQHHLVSCLHNIIQQISPNAITIISSNFDSKNSLKSLVNLTDESYPEDVREMLLQKLHGTSSWPIVFIQADAGDSNVYHGINSSYILMSDADDLIDITDDIREQILIFKMDMDWNPRAHFIVAITHGYGDGKHVAEGILSLMWEFRLINVVVVIPADDLDGSVSKAVVDTYAWFPFQPKGRCANDSEPVLLDRWVSGGFLNKTPLFSYKTPGDLHSCPIYASTKEFAPFVTGLKEIEDGVTYAGGLEIMLMREVTRKLNMQVRYRRPSPEDWGYRLQNGSWTGITGEVDRGESDVAFVDFFHKGKTIRNTEYSRIYLTEHIRWYVPCAKPIARWKSLIRVFKLSLWLGFLATYVFASIATWLVVKLSVKIEGNLVGEIHTSLSKWFLNFWAIIIEESAANDPPELASIRIVFFSWVLYCWAVNTVYQTYLVTFLVDPGFEHQLSSEEEIFQSDIDLGTVESLTTCCIPNLERYPKSRTFNCSDYEKCLNRTVQTSDVAFTFVQHYMDHVIRTRYIGDNGKPLICSFPEYISFQPVVLCFNKGSLYLERFDRVIGGILEAGMLNQWYDSLKYTSTLATFSTLKHVENEEYIKLTVEHLESAFIFLFFGCLISTLTFIVEVGLNRKNNMKTNKKPNSKSPRRM